jgi:hypothetical protein
MGFEDEMEQSEKGLAVRRYGRSKQTDELISSAGKPAGAPRAFRTLKGVALQVRPVHHWLEHRVKAHVFLCMLAYYVEHHMRNALAPILFADHQPEARERARSWRRHSHPPRQSRNAPSGALSTGPQSWPGTISSVSSAH